MNAAIIVVIVAAAIIILVALLAAIHVVQQYERGVVFRLGRVQPTIRQPGLTLVWPLVDRLRKVNMQITTSCSPTGTQQLAVGLRRRRIGYPGCADGVAPFRSGPIGRENPMSVIAWIVLGAIAGLIAEHLTGRKAGLLIATVVGIIGALLGGFLAKTLFHVQTLDTFFNLSTWVTAIIGAVILFLILRAVQGDRRRSRRRRA